MNSQSSTNRYQLRPKLHVDMILMEILDTQNGGRVFSLMAPGAASECTRRLNGYKYLIENVTSTGVIGMWRTPLQETQ